MTWLQSILCLCLVTAPVSVALAQSQAGDPTAPSDPAGYATKKIASKREPGWALHSTLISDSRKIAIINGRAFTEGERVGSARVLHIRSQEVVLATPKQQITLRLLPKNLRNAQP